MKKILVLVVAVVCAGIAQAADYPYLVFVNQSNDTTALSVTGMTLKVNETEIFDGVGFYPAEATGGSSVSLSSYTGGGGGPGGGGGRW